jgi:hypothetical protein
MIIHGIVFITGIVVGIVLMLGREAKSIRELDNIRQKLHNIVTRLENVAYEVRRELPHLK